MEQVPLPADWLGSSGSFNTTKTLRIISSALKDYTAERLNEFEEDYGCKVLYDDHGNIYGLKYSNEASKTMLELKYAR